MSRDASSWYMTSSAIATSSTLSKALRAHPSARARTRAGTSDTRSWTLSLQPRSNCSQSDSFSSETDGGLNWLYLRGVDTEEISDEPRQRLEDEGTLDPSRCSTWRSTTIVCVLVPTTYRHARATYRQGISTTRSASSRKLRGLFRPVNVHPCRNRLGRLVVPTCLSKTTAAIGSLIDFSMSPASSMDRILSSRHVSPDFLE